MGTKTISCKKDIAFSKKRYGRITADDDVFREELVKISEYSFARNYPANTR
jgi:hypothetical protein